MEENKRMLCRIDGDDYEVMPVSAELWQDLNRHDCIPDIKRFLEETRCAIYLKEDPADGAITDESFVWSTAKIAAEPNSPIKLADFIVWKDIRPPYGDIEWNAQGDALTHVPVCLMLTPLDKQLIDITKEFKAQNPNGTVVTGGSIHYRGESKSISFTIKKAGNVYEVDENSIRQEPLTMVNDMKEWNLGDTGEKPIEWLVWDGKLVSLKPVFAAFPENLPKLFSSIEKGAS